MIKIKTIYFYHIPSCLSLIHVEISISHLFSVFSDTGAHTEKCCQFELKSRELAIVLNNG